MTTITRDAIPIGRANAITRSDLAKIWGMTDRQAREAVSRLRTEDSRDPYVICSSSRSPAGYWRTNREDEIAAYQAEVNSRAVNTLMLLKDVRRFRRRVGGQTEMEID